MNIDDIKYEHVTPAYEDEVSWQPGFKPGERVFSCQTCGGSGLCDTVPSEDVVCGDCEGEGEYTLYSAEWL